MFSPKHVSTHSVNRVFSGLADHYSNTSFFSLSSTIIASPLPVLTPPSCSCLLGVIRTSLRYIWNGSSTVRYPFLCALTCTLANEVQLMGIIPRSRTLFRNIRHIFATPTEQVQDSNLPFLRSLSSLRPVYCQRCR
jgi:hypothetical protein